MTSRELFKIKALIASAALLLVGASCQTPPSPTAPAKVSVNTSSDFQITAEVLKNLAYPSNRDAGSNIIKLVDGRENFANVDGGDGGFAQLDNVIGYGDLNADGLNDAVVAININTGGTGVWSVVYAVLNERGTAVPQSSSQLAFQDRDVINSVVIKDGTVAFDLTVHGANDPMCCPTVHQVKTYKFVNGAWSPFAAPSFSAPAPASAKLWPATVTAPVALPAPAAPNGTYKNVDGVSVPSPYAAPSAPAGASAQCRDGTYSFSQHRSGTCSHHGGVAEWL